MVKKRVWRIGDWFSMTTTVSMTDDEDNMATYPVYLKQYDDEIRVASPDLAGCFTEGKDLNDALMNAQYAVEGGVIDYLINDRPVPEPSDVTNGQHEIEYQGGVWGFVEVDMCRLEKEAQDIIDGEGQTFLVDDKS